MSRLIQDDVVWIDTTPQPASLSASEDVERVDSHSPAQRLNRGPKQLPRKRKGGRKDPQKSSTSNIAGTHSVSAHKQIERKRDEAALGLVLGSDSHFRPSVPPTLADSLFDIQRSEFIHSLRTLRLEDSVYAFIPSRIGTSRVVEDAAHAVVAAQKCRLVPSNERSERVHQAAAASYISAIRVLKESLDGSDASLMACLLLQLSTNLSDGRRGSSTAHLDGLFAVLATKAKHIVSQPPTNFASMAFYSLRHLTFWRPVAQGLPSPFDDGCTALLKWTSARRSPTWQEVSLRQIAHKLWVRLPRLIARTRSLRNNDDGADLDKILDLAANLCELHDPDAERWFLRQKATHVPTLAVYTEIVGENSFSFPSIPEWECMVVYWEAQLFLSRLCHELSELAPTGHPTVAKFTNHAHQDRMAQYILMSWQFVHDCCDTGLGVRIKSALIACYSVVHVNAAWQRRSIAALRGWVNSVLHKDGNVSADVKDIGDALAGGPIQPFREWAFGSAGVLGHGRK